MMKLAPRMRTGHKDSGGYMKGIGFWDIFDGIGQLLFWSMVASALAGLLEALFKG